MNETIKELITQNVFDTCASISSLTGAQNDVVAEQDQIRGNPARDRKVTVQDDGDILLDERPQHKDDYTANYTLVCMVATSDVTDAPPVDTERARLVADVRKALMSDWTRGGWAINTMIQSNATLAQGLMDGYSGDLLTVNVLYRTAKDDPYSL